MKSMPPMTRFQRFLFGATVGIGLAMIASAELHQFALRDDLDIVLGALYSVFNLIIVLCIIALLAFINAVIQLITLKWKLALYSLGNFSLQYIVFIITAIIEPAIYSMT